MSKFFPLQKICLLSQNAVGEQLLIAASGPELSAISLRTGEILDQWPTTKEDEPGSVNDDSTNGETSVRPSKRRKVDGSSPGRLSRQTSEASEVSVEIVAERKKGERRRPKLVNHKLPNISHLLATEDGKHIIAVTAEDKMVTVLNLTSSGKLHTLSQRALPKRMCAIKLTSDEKMILAADKFGDVYAIPLLPSLDWAAKPTSGTTQALFTPSATETTVHTKGNLKALKQQRELKTFKQKKESPNFEHQLLLGHVSLLTDLVIACALVNGRERPFILTADRDEHIRVSRGIPQAHIIETYCLGHQDFVSKLCIVPWAPEILVAGNGEPSLRLYQWQTGDLIQKYSLKDEALPLSKLSEGPDGRALDKIAVSGIWPIWVNRSSSESHQSKGVLLVALEGIPILLAFTLSEEGQLIFLGYKSLPGNILDVVQVGNEHEIIVSIDSLHNPNSVREYREDDFSNETCLRKLRVTLNDATDVEIGGAGSIRLEEVDMVDMNLLDCLWPILDVASVANGKNIGYEKTYSPVGEFLYGLENLRKKRDAVADEDVPDED